MLRKKNQCRTCREICRTVESKAVGKCFGCRNINTIKQKRIILWNEYWDIYCNMPQNNRMQVIDKKVVRNELLHCKKNFINSGFMGKDYKISKKEKDRVDIASIKLAMRNPEFEKKINWEKHNKGML